MKLNKVLAITGFAGLLFVGGNSVMAQGRGNFDPAQMRERMMTNLREKMDVKDDVEWKALEGEITKVMDAQREAMASRFSGFGRGGGGGGRPPGGTDPAPTDQGSSRRRGGMFGGEPSPEVEALQKAVDSKASSDELKAKLSAVRKSNKAKEKKLEDAQANLKKVLTVRQEAVAVLNGLLK